MSNFPLAQLLLARNKEKLTVIALENEITRKFIRWTEIRKAWILQLDAGHWRTVSLENPVTLK